MDQFDTSAAVDRTSSAPPHARLIFAPTSAAGDHTSPNARIGGAPKAYLATHSGEYVFEGERGGAMSTSAFAAQLKAALQACRI